MTPFRTWLSRRRYAGVLVFVAFLAACGTVDDNPVSGETLTGIYIVTAAQDAEGEIVLGEPPSALLETEFSTLRIDAGCNDHFGSFTLDDGGAASFTVTGQSNQDCDAETEATDQRVLAAFDQVDTWTIQNDTLTLNGTDVSLTLER